MKIILDRSDPGRWRVTLGPRVEFIGKRPECKRAARGLCRREGHRSWFNRKATGELVEVAL